MTRTISPPPPARLRDPLSVLNPSPSTSAETPRGCFRFLKARTTAAESPAAARPRSSQTEKPAVGRSRSRERAHRFCVVDPSQHQRRKAASFRSERRRESLDSDQGKSSVSEFSFKPVLDARRRAPEVSDTPAAARPAGAAAVSTPETVTPPLNASVSPEIRSMVCGKFDASYACFGAGHVLSGVADKRKCKARNWIDVEKDCNFSKLDGVLCNGVVTPPHFPSVSIGIARRRSLGFEGLVKPSKLVSDVTPPSSGHAGCKMKSCEDLNREVFNGESLLSSSRRAIASSDRDDMVDDAAHCSPEFEGFVDTSVPFVQSGGSSLLSVLYNSCSRSSIVDSVNRIGCPRVDVNGKNVEKMTPAKMGVLWPSSSVSKTPTSCLDDFSNSATRLTSNASNVSYVLTPLEKKWSQLYLATKTAPFQADSLSGNILNTCKSTSGSGEQPRSVINRDVLLDYQCGLNSSADTSKALKTSLPNPIESIKSDVFLPSKPSHAVPCQVTPLNSVGGSRSKPGNIFENASELRISWREGLISRIYEMEESDCQWSSSEEEFDQFKSDLRLSFAPLVKSSTLIDDDEDKDIDDNDIQFVKNYRSSDFIYTNQMVVEKKLTDSSSKNFPLAESMSIEDSSLVASDNSDWTICYKNQLFKEC